MVVAKRKPRVKIKMEYIKLKCPADVLAYVQRLINNIRDNGLELDTEYVGKIVYLLNTWLAAYKVNLDTTEIQQMRLELAELKKQFNESCHGPFITVAKDKA